METLNRVIQNFFLFFENYVGEYICSSYALHVKFFKNFETYPFASGFILLVIILTGIIIYIKDKNAKFEYNKVNKNYFVYWLLVFIVPFLIPLAIVLIMYSKYEEAKE